jgi:hypothetical protein
MPWIVSMDDHVVEPPDLWSSRLPAKYKEEGPRIEYLPMGNPILEGGYPHQDATWPHTEKVAQEIFGHLDAHTVRKIARGNAIRLLGLDLAP